MTFQKYIYIFNIYIYAIDHILCSAYDDVIRIRSWLRAALDGEPAAVAPGAAHARAVRQEDLPEGLEVDALLHQDAIPAERLAVSSKVSCHMGYIYIHVKVGVEALLYRPRSCLRPIFEGRYHITDPK